MGEGRVDVELDVEQGLDERGVLDPWPTASQRWTMIDNGHGQELDSLDELRNDLVTSAERILGAAAEAVSAFRYDNRYRPHVHASDPDRLPSPTRAHLGSAELHRFLQDTWSTLTIRLDVQQGRFTASAVIDDDNLWLVHRTSISTIPAHRRIAQPTDPDLGVIAEIITAQPEGISANTATLCECTWLIHHPEDPDGVICGPAGITVIAPAGAWALDYHPNDGIDVRQGDEAADLAACLTPPQWQVEATLDHIAKRPTDPPTPGR